eukprot:gene14320-5318_t
MAAAAAAAGGVPPYEGPELQPGMLVWYQNKKDGWKKGTLVTVDPQFVTVVDGDKKPTGFQLKGPAKMLPSHCYPRLPGAFDPDRPDLFEMADFHQSNLLHCLKQRYD